MYILPAETLSPCPIVDYTPFTELYQSTKMADYWKRCSISLLDEDIRHGRISLRHLIDTNVWGNYQPHFPSTQRVTSHPLEIASRYACWG